MFYKSYLACNDRKAFFTSTDRRGFTLWSWQNVCDALSYILDNVYTRFGNKLYRQIVGIPMSTNCAPLVADFVLFCYERDLMTSLSNDNQTDIIETFNSTSRYILNIDNSYFEGTINHIYPPELILQIPMPHIWINIYPFLMVLFSPKFRINTTTLIFYIVNFPFFGWSRDVPCRPSYGVYISQLIRFAGVFSHVEDFNARNKWLTAKLLKQGYRYHKLRKAFSKFYRRHYELISKLNVRLKSLLH